MTASAFSAYLPHFTVEALADLDAAKHMRRLGRAAEAEPGRTGPAEAEERGRREARAEAVAEIERARLDQEAEFALRLAEREREIMRMSADLLADRLVAGLAQIESTIADQVARVLRRFLGAAVRRRAVDELAETVAALVSGDHHVRVAVAGPEPLVARLRERLAPLGDGIACSVSDQADLTVSVDDTIVETRIAAWGERIAADGEANG